jgi:thiol-disulfide isomerase/thioredoxin
MKIPQTAFCFLLSAFFLITTFAQKTTLSGKIENNRFTQADLQLLYKDDGISFGNAKINADGTFKLIANLPKTDLYKLDFGNGAQMMLCLSPNQNIEFVVDATDLTVIKSVKGSPSMEFCKNTAEMINAIRVTFDSIRTALQEDKEAAFYNDFQSKFKPLSDAHKDADTYCALTAQFVDSLQKYVNSKLIKGKVDSKQLDAFIYTGSNIVKEIVLNYSKYASYMQSMALFHDFKNNRNQKFESFYNSGVDKYFEFIAQRDEKMKNAFASFVAQAENYINLRDSLVINDLSNKKKEKELLATAIIELSKKCAGAKEAEASLINAAKVADGYAAYSLQEAQRKISTIVQKYQTLFNNEEKKNNDAIVKYLLANKNDLAVLMFIELFPKDTHAALHQEVIKALYAKYPEHPIVSERYKAETTAPPSTSIGAMAPDLAFENPEGKILKLSDLRGKVVLLDFWASWCRPCRMENPNVVNVYKKYNSKGFEVFSVSIDRDKASWIKGIQDDGLIWQYHVSDLGYWQSKALKIYGVSSVPATFLINKEGKIIAKNLRGAALENALKELFD